jgi:hypothetical protein
MECTVALTIQETQHDMTRYERLSSDNRQEQEANIALETPEYGCQRPLRGGA